MEEEKKKKKKTASDHSSSFAWPELSAVQFKRADFGLWKRRHDQGGHA